MVRRTHLPDHQLIVIARNDDMTFGILHSRFHEMWSLRLGTSLEDRPRYTPTTTFETFPFPDGLSPDIPAADYADNPHAVAIAEAARRLVELRDHWLNPTVDGPVPGQAPVPRNERQPTSAPSSTTPPQWLADDAALDAGSGSLRLRRYAGDVAIESEAGRVKRGPR